VNALAHLLALLQFVLLGFGVTVVGDSTFKNLCWGLALFVLGFLLSPAVNIVRRVES
jgi:hypothetical protein